MSTTKPHRARRTLLIGGLATAGLIAGCAASSGHGTTAQTPAASTHAAASPAASPSRTVVRQWIGWQCKVTGDPADVTYGNDSDEHQGTGPMRATMPASAGAYYWYCQAQLQGYGTVKAKVLEVTATRWSDGHTTRTRKVVAHATGSGGYAIANAEYTGLDAGITHP